MHKVYQSYEIHVLIKQKVPNFRSGLLL